MSLGSCRHLMRRKKHTFGLAPCPSSDAISHSNSTAPLQGHRCRQGATDSAQCVAARTNVCAQLVADYQTWYISIASSIVEVLNKKQTSSSSSSSVPNLHLAILPCLSPIRWLEPFFAINRRY